MEPLGIESFAALTEPEVIAPDSKDAELKGTDQNYLTHLSRKPKADAKGEDHGMRQTTTNRQH